MQLQMQNIHDALRRDLLNAIQRSGDYSYPETESGYVSGVFETEPNLEALAEFCGYVINAGNTVYDGECPPGFSVHGISQARIPEWVAISSSPRGSSQLRD